MDAPSVFEADARAAALPFAAILDCCCSGHGLSVHVHTSFSGRLTMLFVLYQPFRIYSLAWIKEAYSSRA